MGVYELINESQTEHVCFELFSYLVVMASLAKSTQRSSCHNHRMIVGDGHGLIEDRRWTFKTDLTKKEQNHVESERF